MNKIITLAEILFLTVGGLFAINYLIENVLDIDYTADWKVVSNYSDPEYANGGSKIVVVRDTKDVFFNGIMRQRQNDRLGLYFFYGFFIVGYFCAKAARNEIKRRGEIIPADGTQTLDAQTIASNRRIAGMRFVSFLMFVVFIIGITMVIFDNPMARNDSTGHLLCVNTNPYCADNDIPKFLFMMYMPIVLWIGPFFALRKITNVFSVKYSLVFVAVNIVFIIICLLLHIRPYSAALIANVIFASFYLKMNIVLKNIFGF